jgi:DNA-binding transcriptional MerR regulator
LKLVALQILKENKEYGQVAKRWKKIVILTLRAYYLPFKQIKKSLKRNDVHENENERLSKFTQIKENEQRKHCKNRIK